MNDENLQEVYYDRYCKTCKHKKLPEEADPCDECLSNPVNYATHSCTYGCKRKHYIYHRNLLELGLCRRRVKGSVNCFFL